MAQAEAQAAFGDDAVFVEKLLRPARHIEVQVLADLHGNLVALGERECSVQRRRQKLIEEAPSPVVDARLRERLEEAALTVARVSAYTNAGTVEFLLYDEDRFAFMEMNTRLQVEHPVTEMVRGVDLVAEQLRVAAGERLRFAEGVPPIHGWAMECRITAEDPYAGFVPGSGTVYYHREPSGPGIRLESMLQAGQPVSVHYDSLLAKLIAWGVDREQCRRRLGRALDEFEVLGVPTSIPFHRAMLEDPRFIAGQVHTTYVEEEFRFQERPRPDTSLTAALAAAAYLQTEPPAAAASGNSREQGRAWGAFARGRRSHLELGWRRSSH
jgi:acetyl/propionyl-CoA carboxylase alpha subunit